MRVFALAVTSLIGASACSSESVNQAGSGGSAGSGPADAGADAPCRCVPAPPEGWNGPIAYHAGVGTAPVCGAPYPDVAFSGHADPEFTPATCSACSCAAPQVTCSGNIEFGNAACNQTPTTTSQAQLTSSSGCQPMSAAPGGSAHFYPGPTTGTCAPSGGKPSAATVGWKKSPIGCSGAGEACDSGVCAPAAGEGFDAAACIWRQGQFDCIPGVYPNKRSTLFQSFSDTRDCSACACAPSTDSTCSMSVLGYPKGDCGGQITKTIEAGVCTDPGPSAAVRLDASPTPGTCTPSGGSPVGTVTPTEPITVCCR
ncbi:MAG: hypothetical protein U0263_24110 [Polyangiaceae bacterium]